MTLLPPPSDGAPATKCVVPKLKGKTLGKAKSALIKANCKLGKVKKPKGSRGKKLIVKSTKPGAGAERAAGTKVGVTMKVKPQRRR